MAGDMPALRSANETKRLPSLDQLLLDKRRLQGAHPGSASASDSWGPSSA